ncbi:MAG: zinc-ribbon domain-containing protein [Vulcanimicrobiota bacterium]
MILCMRCGAQNNPDENYCQSCGATLPKLAYSMEMAAVEKVMDLYYKFEDAVNKLRNGEWSENDFEDFAVGMQAKLGQREEEIKEVEIDEEIMDDFEAELEVGFQGVEKINDGVDTLLDYLEDKNESHLDNGLGFIKQGLELIHQARIINRERDKRLNADADAYRQEGTMEL